VTDLISEADFLKALKSGHRRTFRELRALAVAYSPAQDTVDIVMADGWRIQIDRARIAELAGLSPYALENLSLSPAGTAIELDAEDVHISLEGLLATIIPVKALARRISPVVRPMRKSLAD
jgi:hypothetical protein